MAVGKLEAESQQDVTDSKQCENCKEIRPSTNFRPSSYILADGTKKAARRPICRSCERDSRLARGQCNNCVRPKVEGRNYCEKCLKQVRDLTRNRGKADRQKCLEHYGRKCSYCLQTIEIFLTIDHINNDGAEHRRSMTSNKESRGRAGSTIYAWLRRNDFPEGFQILCYNCNIAKHHHGEEAVRKALIDRVL